MYPKHLLAYRPQVLNSQELADFHEIIITDPMAAGQQLDTHLSM